MNRIGIVCKLKEHKAFWWADKIMRHCPNGTMFFTEIDAIEEMGHKVVAGLRQIEVDQDLDLIIVLGGDGTFVHASSYVRNTKTPLLGVNMGTLGFITEFTENEFEKEMPYILSGLFQWDERLRIDTKLVRNGKTILHKPALNDAVVSKGALARISTLKLSIDGLPVTHIRADGVIVATPTGSTGYNLSAGGPIMSNTIEAMIISPICPHSLTHRPLAVSANKTIELELVTDNSEVFLTLDGQKGELMKAGDKVIIDTNVKPLRVVSNQNRHYFDLIREKLSWGKV